MTTRPLLAERRFAPLFWCQFLSAFNDNLLKNAPHTQADVTADVWERPYSRQEAGYPLPWVAENKFWPSVNRIDDVYGDRNLHCSCVPMEDYGA